MFPEESKYDIKEKKKYIKKFITDHIDISSDDSDIESSAEENSDKENSDEKNLMKKILMKIKYRIFLRK